MALWNEMFNHSIRLLGGKHSGMMIENCHNGGPAGNTPHYDSKGELQCPYHTCTFASALQLLVMFGFMLTDCLW